MSRLRRPSLETVITLVVVAGAVLFVLFQLSPSLLITNTTPAGGDTGAHVWGPHFLQQHLLPQGRITGWAPAWYAGFPAYTFYFPLPALLIALLAYILPYGIAFKLVTVLGLLSLPVAAYVFGRLSGMRFPGPPVLAVATVPYLFYYGFYDKATGAWSNTIYGGNIASSLAGEFAFSISLSLALVFLGVVARGLRTGRHRALAAILLALTGLCHLLPTIFAVGGAGVLFLLQSGRKRAVWLATSLGLGACLAGFWTLPFLFRFRSYANNMGWEKITHYMDNLFPSGILWVVLLAAIGAIFSVMFRRRTGLALVGLAVLAGLVFVYAPEARLWNARALPFWYLCVYLLAGVGVAEMGTSIANLLGRDGPLARRPLAFEPGLDLGPGSDAEPPASFAFFPAPSVPAEHEFAESTTVAVATERTESKPAEPERAEPERAETEPAEAGPTETGPTEPTEPELTEPEATEAEPTETGPTEPTEPEPTEPEPTEPEATEAEPTEPTEPTEPVAPFPEPVGSRPVLLLTPIVVAIGAWMVVGLPLHVLPSWVGLPSWRWVLLLALAAALAASSFRRAAAIALAVVAVGSGAATIGNLGGSWDSRVGSLFHLCLFLLAAIALVEIAIWVLTRSTGAVREGRAGWAEITIPVLAALVAWVAIGSPLELTRKPIHQLTTNDTNFLPSWARWNYSGYERKTAYPEYRGIIDTMARVGREYGCGRAHWEYESGLDRFGTPLALMLLPYWTNECIGSMEGLYFESSATVPYHFLSAGELSKAPSNPMRDLPYRGLNVADGVKHLQLLGARYYLAFSPEVIAQANANPDLTEIASTGAWRVYLIKGSELVQPLDFAPAVMTGPHGGTQWLDASVDWWMDFSRHDVLLAGDGPKNWPRVAVRTHPTTTKTKGSGVTIDAAPHDPVAPVTVTKIHSGDSNISFDVDRVGSPVLVKVSYFPNWQASGAKGPYRVTPNLMVVVPTSHHVSLHYGNTPVDIAGWMLTFIGLGGVILVSRRPMSFSDDPAGDGPAGDGGAGDGPVSGAEPGDDDRRRVTDEEFEMLPARRSQPVPIPGAGERP